MAFEGCVPVVEASPCFVDVDNYSHLKAFKDDSIISTRGQAWF